MSEDKLLIIGLGNPLMGDDGAGIEVINELQGLDLPEYVDVIDGGTPGVGLIDLMSGYSKVVVVDAVIVEGGILSDTPVMRLQLIKGDSVVRDDRMGLDEGCSLHETELTSVLRLMQTLGMTIPEITIVGIPAVNIAPGIGLSEVCRGLIPQAVHLIKDVVAEALNRDSAYLFSSDSTCK